jgi:DNA (cytosine-5)-methyltransferase 1
MLRVIQEARPAWIIGENVAGIVNLALDQVCADLEGQGYEVEPIIVPACAVDAPHRRDRVWIIARNLADTVSLSAHGSKEWGCVRGREDEDISQRNEMGSNSSDSREDVANANGGQFSECESERKSVQMSGEGSQRICDVADTVSQRGCGGNSKREYAEDARESSRDSRDNSRGVATWIAEPNVGRVAHGIPNRVAKLRGLGNAIVPQVASEIIRCINKIMEDNK